MTKSIPRKKISKNNGKKYKTSLELNSYSGIGFMKINPDLQINLAFKKYKTFSWKLLLLSLSKLHKSS